MTGTDVKTVKWGTWEELLLGGAVLRHGTGAWEAVASELRCRTLYPHGFTPEVCKAKYEELQNRFRGHTSGWFEELRKHRVAELKRQLEKSEDSIGSLKSKLESLKAEKKAEEPETKYGSGQNLSPTSVANATGADFSSKDTSKEHSGKEISKDGLSAGSFTEETRTDYSPECQIPTTTPEMKIKAEQLGHYIYGCRPCKKRRGKRKRRDCSTIKEEFIDLGSSADKAESTGDCDRAVGSACAADPKNQTTGDAFNNVDQKDEEVGDEHDVLTRILYSVMENEHASVFSRRLDSQKKPRYKKTIRRHMDLATLRLRVSLHLITSVRELYHDLLLLCNNAIIFYPRDSNEHRSAVSLRDYVTEKFRHYKPFPETEFCGCASGACEHPPPRPPVKPRSVRPVNRRVENVVSEETPVEETKKQRTADATQLPVVEKKGQSRPRKVRRSSVWKQTEIPGKGRKRAQRR